MSRQLSTLVSSLLVTVVLLTVNVDSSSSSSSTVSSVAARVNPRSLRHARSLKSLSSDDGFSIQQVTTPTVAVAAPQSQFQLQQSSLDQFSPQPWSTLLSSSLNTHSQPQLQSQSQLPQQLNGLGVGVGPGMALNQAGRQGGNQIQLQQMTTTTPSSSTPPQLSTPTPSLTFSSPFSSSPVAGISSFQSTQPTSTPTSLVAGSDSNTVDNQIQPLQLTVPTSSSSSSSPSLFNVNQVGPVTQTLATTTLTQQLPVDVNQQQLQVQQPTPFQPTSTNANQLQQQQQLTPSAITTPTIGSSTPAGTSQVTSTQPPSVDSNELSQLSSFAQPITSAAGTLVNNAVGLSLIPTSTNASNGTDTDSSTGIDSSSLSSTADDESTESSSTAADESTDSSSTSSDGSDLELASINDELNSTIVIDSSSSSSSSSSGAGDESSSVESTQLTSSTTTSTQSADEFCSSNPSSCQPPAGTSEPTSCDSTDFTCQVTKSCWSCYNDRSSSFCPTCLQLQQCADQTCQLQYICTFCQQLTQSGREQPPVCQAVSCQSTSSTGLSQ